MLEWILLGLARDSTHPTRARILAVVGASPGITLTRLRECVGCSWGTIQYHTQALERSDRLRSEPVGRSRRFFTDETPRPKRRALALLRSGRVRELVEAIRERPGVVQRELTDELHITRKVLRGYVDDLVGAGLVVETPASRTRTYHATASLDALLAALGPSGIEEQPGSGESGARPHTAAPVRARPTRS